MDPLSHLAADALAKGVGLTLEADLREWPTVLVSAIMRQLLDLTVVLSDELDRRQAS